MKAFKFLKKNIVIISPEPWGENLLSKHHIALALASRNNKVWFVTATGHNSAIEFNVHENIKLITYRPLRGISRLYRPIAKVFSWFDVKKLCGFINAEIDVVWSFDPFHLPFLKLFGAPLTIYHPVDNHYTKLEKWILREADIVFSNSDITLSRMTHKQKFKIGHGISSHFFHHTITRPALPGHFKIRAAYVGNLNNKLFDFDLLVRLAQDHPTVGFYLIGPRAASNLSSFKKSVFDWTKAERLPNVFLLGQKPSSQIPSFLALMDILLVLYKPDQKGITVNSHKLLEYLSSGKLIVAPVHPDNTSIKHLMLEAATVSDVPAVFKHAVNNLPTLLSPEVQRLRKEIARSMSYEKRIEEVETVISKTINNI